MPTRVISLAVAVIGASAVLTSAVVCPGTASADSKQDQFLALLAQLQIPATDNVPGLVYRAGEICGELDHGASFQSLVDEETNTMYAGNPALRLAADRVNRTAVRFITASVTVYCPNHQSQLPPS